MKVIVIGLGSMGKRRIRLIRQFDETIEIVGVDAREDRRKDAQSLYHIETAESIEECRNEAVAAFVCTSPLSHHVIITECLNQGLHVFTELNLVADDYDKNMQLASEKGLKLFLSSTILYRDEVKYINKRVASSKSKVNYTYHVGQYLPDWHPWENYKDFFVGDARTNGCREFLAIELPWIQKVFGEISAVEVRKSKNSSLNLSYNDNYMILMEHKSGAKGTLAVDVLSRKAVRNLEIYSEDLYLSWDGSGNGLYDYDIEKKENRHVELYEKVDHQDGYNQSIVENADLSEVETFFAYIAGEKIPEYGFAEDKKTIKYLDLIEG